MLVLRKPIHFLSPRNFLSSHASAKSVGMFEAVGVCDVSPLWSYYVVEKEYQNLFY